MTWTGLDFLGVEAPPDVSADDVRAGRAVLKKGSRGEAVKYAQAALMLEADGDFGSKTEAAVKKMQSAEGLAPDGVVGMKTMAAIDRLLGGVLVVREAAAAPAVAAAKSPVAAVAAAAKSPVSPVTVGMIGLCVSAALFAALQLVRSKVSK
jgi:peptidoglycan hydrolase-like protein with peptidoglycan-binding domain